MPIIEAKQLTKSFRIAQRQPGLWGALGGLLKRTYRKVYAVSDISFSIEPGEMIGYIGPNGAGKSTTVKLLAGIMVPDKGHCQVMGNIPWLNRKENAARIGVVFGQRSQLWWDLPVVESFELLRDIYRVPEQTYRRNLDELVSMLSISAFLDTPVRQLSLGQRMRCELIASLLHEPRLLFLDEPTIGLDAVSKLAVRAFIHDLNQKRGVTVLLTTHDMDDIEALCRRVMVIDKGRLFLDGTLDALRERITAERRLVLDLEDKVNGAFQIPQTERVSSQGHRVTLRFNPKEVRSCDLISRITSRHAVRDLFVEAPPIEELLVRLYGETKV